jgi:hypothetical protein
LLTKKILLLALLLSASTKTTFSCDRGYNNASTCLLQQRDENRTCKLSSSLNLKLCLAIVSTISAIPHTGPAQRCVDWLIENCHTTDRLRGIIPFFQFATVTVHTLTTFWAYNAVVDSFLWNKDNDTKRISYANLTLALFSGCIGEINSLLTTYYYFDASIIWQILKLLSSISLPTKSTYDSILKIKAEAGVEKLEPQIQKAIKEAQRDIILLKEIIFDYDIDNEEQIIEKYHSKRAQQESLLYKALLVATTVIFVVSLSIQFFTTSHLLERSISSTFASQAIAILSILPFLCFKLLEVPYKTASSLAMLISTPKTCIDSSLTKCSVNILASIIILFSCPAVIYTTLINAPQDYIIPLAFMKISEHLIISTYTNFSILNSIRKIKSSSNNSNSDLDVGSDQELLTQISSATHSNILKLLIAKLKGSDELQQTSIQVSTVYGSL